MLQVWISPVYFDANEKIKIWLALRASTVLKKEYVKAVDQGYNACLGYNAPWRYNACQGTMPTSTMSARVSMSARGTMLARGTMPAIQ